MEEEITMPEKKCVNCENMDFCAMYRHMVDASSMFVVNLNKSIDEKDGFTNLADTMAHDCKRFSAFKEGA